MSEDCIREVPVIITEEPAHTIALKSNTLKNTAHINGCKTLKLPFKTEYSETEDCVTVNHLISNRIKLQSITALSLTLCDLTSLPSSLTALENLKSLNLSRNKLKEVPLVLELGIHLLENLDLSFNVITEFETEPKCYKKIRTLKINNNMMTNIPGWILYARCFNLEELIYSYNNISCLNVSRYHTSRSYELRKLEMVNCNVLPEDITSFISKIRTLQELNLSNDKSRNSLNSVGDELFEKCSWTNKLQVLKLNHMNLSIVSANIVNLVNLRVLELQNGNLTWLPDNFTGLVNLEELDVSRNCITYLPSDLKVLSNLRILKVQYNQLCVVPDITGMCNLKYLDLYENLLEDCDLDVSSVESIDLEMNYIDTSQLAVIWEYSKRKLLLREKADQLSRRNGKKETSVYLEEPDSCSTDESYGEDVDEGFTLSYHHELEEEEQWDEVKPEVNDDYVRVCSLSDEEWEGYEKRVVRNGKRVNVQRQPSFLFVDAAE